MGSSNDYKYDRVFFASSFVSCIYTILYMWLCVLCCLLLFLFYLYIFFYFNNSVVIVVVVKRQRVITISNTRKQSFHNMLAWNDDVCLFTQMYNLAVENKNSNIQENVKIKKKERLSEQFKKYIENVI